MTAVKRRAHGRIAALGLEVVHIIEQFFLRRAEVIGDRITIVRTQDRRGRAVDGATILHVETANLRELAFVGAIGGQKLCHYSHRLCGINCETRALTIECFVAHPEGVNVASVLVTHALVALTLVIVAALDAFAPQLATHSARVRSVRCSHAVGLPNIHLCATRSVLPSTHVVVFVIRIRIPINDVGLTVDELDIVRALRIAITGAVVGTGLIVSEALASVVVHLNEIHGTINAAFKMRDINVHRELPILQIKHLVAVIAIQQVQARANIRTMGVFSDEAQLDTAVYLRDAILTGVTISGHTFDSAPLSASYWVIAQRCIPRIPRVTILISAC
jgi:hypothetical protein